MDEWHSVPVPCYGRSQLVNSANNLLQSNQCKHIHAQGYFKMNLI